MEYRILRRLHSCCLSVSTTSFPAVRTFLCVIAYLTVVLPTHGQTPLEATPLRFAAQGIAPNLLEDGLFGHSVALMGDLDGDGMSGIAVGAPNHYDPLSATHIGAVWILYLDDRGRVREARTILPDQFLGTAEPVHHFGESVGAPGDVDQNGVNDLAVGDPEAGVVWVLTLDDQGGIDRYQNIVFQSDSLISPPPGPPQSGEAGFGTSVAGIGDVNGDGLLDLAVGDPVTQSVWIVFMKADLTIKSSQRIDDTSGGFTGDIVQMGAFGEAVTPVGDLDGNGVPDIAVGAPGYITGSLNHYGVVWVLYLNADGTVASHELVFPDAFTGTADPVSSFGTALSWIPVPHENYQGTLLVGAPRNGTVWLVSLAADGAFARQHYLAQDRNTIFIPPFPNPGTPGFGRGLADLGDLDGDGLREMAIGSPFDRDSTGLLWVHHPTHDGRAAPPYVIGAMDVAIPPDSTETHYGAALANIGDLNLDGIDDLAIGSPFMDTPFPTESEGVIWLLFMTEDHRIELARAVPQREIGGAISGFGMIVSAAGDLNKDGYVDLAVGNPVSGNARFLYMMPNGLVRETMTLVLQQGELVQRFSPEFGTPGFGASVAVLGDLRNDGGQAIAIGDTSSQNIWIVFLNAFGNLDGSAMIGEGLQGFTADLADHDLFGAALALPGDLDGNGVPDLIVGAPGDQTRFHRGAVYVLFLDEMGSVLSHVKIQADNHFGTADPVSPFGAVLTGLEDQNADGIRELAVGIPDRGTAAILRLRSDGSVSRAFYLARSDGGIVQPTIPTSGLDGFGQGIAELDDLNADGVNELLVSSPFEMSGDHTSGVVWQIDLCSANLCPPSVNLTPDPERNEEASIVLEPNAPNPFGRVTFLRFELPSAMRVRLSVYDVLGREVKVLVDGHRTAGNHQVLLEADNLASGVYVYRLETGYAATSRLLNVVR